eukprot:gene10027-9835_t
MQQARLPSTASSDATAVPDRNAAQQINQQLLTHEQGRVQWQGEAWPGQPMQWEIRRQNEREARGRSSGGEADATPVWRSNLRLRFAELGELNASITLVGQQIHLQLQTDDAASGATLRAQASVLEQAMAAAGIPLTMTDEQSPRAVPRAVALAYGVNDAAPKVVAKGRGLIAEQIIDIALEAGVFVHESRDLVEIISLLRGIGAKKQLIRMLIQGENDVCVTSILDVDEDSNTVILDTAVDTAQNKRILSASRLSFETSLDKVRILFAADGASATTYGGSPAYRIPVPASLIRLQRREYYRIATPVSNPVRVLLKLPEELGGPTSFPLADISCGGIAILDNKMVLGEAIGREFKECKLELPEIGPVITDLQVRNSLDLTLLNNKSNRRLGCEFMNISRGNLAAVQRYITRLERERNARIAGLN